MRAALSVLLLALCACQPPEESHARAIIGAVLIDGAGGPPLTNSVVLIAEGRIQQAGREGEIPVSGETAKIDGSGKYLVPALIDIAQGAQKSAIVHVFTAGQTPAAVEALLESARDRHVPVAGHPTSQADAQLLVQNGAAILIGMIAGPAPLDPDFVARLRDLRIIYAPALSAVPPADLQRAGRNTAALFAAGVPLAVASTNGDILHECELMADAGVPPLDVIVAATQNGARALGLSDRGLIQPGKRADFLLLRANPGEDIRNLRSR